jgi:hypothetical protein
MEKKHIKTLKFVRNEDREIKGKRQRTENIMNNISFIHLII